MTIRKPLTVQDAGEYFMLRVHSCVILFLKLFLLQLAMSIGSMSIIFR